MRNLKKLLAFIVVAAMMITASLPAFAADAATLSAEAKACSDIGMLLGNGNGVTADYTATQPSRLQAAILLLRLKGLEADAKAFTGTDNFSDVTVAWEKPYTAYLKAHPELGFAGIGDGKFDPDSKITAAQYYKVVLTALGYTVKADANDTKGDYLFADVITFAAGKGLTKVAAVTSFTINDLAVATVEGLNAAVKGGTDSLATTLVKAGQLDAAKAEAAGVYKPVVAKALDLSGAVAINSKIVEVSLGTAATDADLAAAGFIVKDAAGKAIAVKSAAFAPYSTDNKAVLVTLDADTAAGTLYTITSGSVSKNFGGKAVDTGKPEVNTVTSTDYNKVKITFKEPIQLGGTVTLAEKYGTKADLAVSDISYSGNDTLILTTADQKGATLYGVTVKGFKDFAGNVMDDSTDKTFVGTKKNADDLVVKAAYGKNNPEEVTVQLNVRVDAATVTPANFKVEEMYGTKAALTVTEARVATKDDKSTDGTTSLAEDQVANSTTDAYRFVVLTVPGTKDSTLYKVTASGLKSVYGKSLSSTDADTYKTFVGKKKPTDPFSYTITGGAGQSNTTVKFVFDNKVVKADAENIANYAIAEAYGAKAALAVTKAALDGDGKTVTLTTAAMKSVLYKLTVTGVKDTYGNSIKTEDDANIQNFSGKAVAGKIDSITSINYDTNSDTVIVVTFNHNVGSSYSDVSHYTIDHDVGYVIKAEEGANDNQVKLTIPKLTVGTVYKLTVKGLENADGVAMDSAGISKSFIGAGNDAGLPQIEGVVATDKQTLKIMFDRDVTDDTLKGTVWSDSSYTLTSGVFTVKGISSYGTSGSKDLASYTEYAYQDSVDKNTLVVRVDLPDFISDNARSDGTFELDGNNTYINSDHDAAGFAPSSDDAAAITIDNVLALNKKSIRVYFNQPVEIANVSNFAKIAITDAAKNQLKSNFGYTTDVISLASPVAIDDTHTVYDFSFTGASDELAAGSNFLVVNYDTKTNLLLAIHDWTEGSNPGYVTMKDEDDANTTINQWREFAGSSDNAGQVDSVSAIMPNARTMEVYYPEAMNNAATGTVSAIVATNYTFYNGGKAAGNIVTPSVTNVEWDSKTNKVTFTFDANLPGSVTDYYVKPAATIANAIGTKTVKDSDGNAIFVQFAKADNDADKVTVSSATYSAGVITVELNMRAKTTDDITTNLASLTNLYNLFEIKLVTGTTTPTTVTLDKIDGTQIDSVVAKDGDGNTVTSTASGYLVKKIVITLDPTFAATLTANKVGSIKIKTDSEITGIDGMAGNTDDVVDIAQK